MRMISATNGTNQLLVVLEEPERGVLPGSEELGKEVGVAAVEVPFAPVMGVRDSVVVPEGDGVAAGVSEDEGVGDGVPLCPGIGGFVKGKSKVSYL